MSNELTAEEYLDTQLALGWDYIDIETAETYGDLRAKEAVKEFAEELMLYDKRFATLSDQNSTVSAVLVSKIKALAKQKGVEI